MSRWGMSDALGPRVYGDNQSEVFLGRDVTTHKNLSDATAQLVDSEITRVIDEQYKRARGIIESNADKIRIMAKALMDWETLDSKQIEEIMQGNTLTPPDSSDDNSDSSGNSDSTRKKQDDESRPKIHPQMDKPTGEH